MSKGNRKIRDVRRRADPEVGREHDVSPRRVAETVRMAFQAPGECGRPDALRRFQFGVMYQIFEAQAQEAWISAGNDGL